MADHPPMRADARRNREQILRAAHAAFVEYGPAAPLDQIAERAGVGNATLYRHFPTREDLIHSVAVHDMDQVAATATDALDSSPSAWEAIRTFASQVVEHQSVAMLPILGGQVESGPRFSEAAARVLSAVDSLVDAARAEGTLRPDVTSGDLILFLAVATRPLPALSPALATTLRDRLLGTLLDGLRAGESAPLPGLGMTAEGIVSGLSGAGTEE
ncbi:TetR/AcrR family transcriptional regulator [Nonomuraea sp. NPDC050328]|uniref:TetR/AcrR family transcriptional regulator n=1 Tax=Nonomuraea sp. NPDC050328 TaxID=3364361 RepID=UPI0037ABB786